MRRFSGSEAAVCSSHGRTDGHWRASSGTSARARRDRTACTWTGSALWDAHITAISRSVKSNGAQESDTIACSGFMHDLANRSRSASPAKAISFPSVSTTATSPECTDSSNPERSTRANGTEGTMPKTTGTPIGSQHPPVDQGPFGEHYGDEQGHQGSHAAGGSGSGSAAAPHPAHRQKGSDRSEEHTSELQSRVDLVCR